MLNVPESIIKSIEQRIDLAAMEAAHECCHGWTELYREFYIVVRLPIEDDDGYLHNHSQVLKYYGVHYKVLMERKNDY